MIDRRFAVRQGHVVLGVSIALLAPGCWGYSAQERREIDRRLQALEERVQAQPALDVQVPQPAEPVTVAAPTVEECVCQNVTAQQTRGRSEGVHLKLTIAHPAAECVVKAGALAKKGEAPRLGRSRCRISAEDFF